MVVLKQFGLLLGGVLALDAALLCAALSAGSGPFLKLGLVCTLASLGLWIADRWEQTRRLEELEQAHRADRAELEQRHTRTIIALREQNQRAMAAFRSTLSHSLRMPVAIIQGYADLLTSGVITDQPTTLEYLAKISQRCQYMTETMSRQFSAADSIDASKLMYTDLDLVTLVRQAAADMQSAAQEQGVRIQVVSAEDALPMRGDAYLLNRVLFNLLENALKYMGRPGSITIRIRQQEDAVSLLVQDDGMGLSAQETPRIFEASYQGSNHSGGQGYGLYLVRQAIAAHGGSVSAQSAPGRGMGITMTLPLKPSGEPVSA